MDYYEFGNVQDAQGISEDLYISGFGQVLSGLEHLH